MRELREQHAQLLQALPVDARAEFEGPMLFAIDEGDAQTHVDALRAELAARADIASAANVLEAQSQSSPT
jgi:hypothetical protein